MRINVIGGELDRNEIDAYIKYAGRSIPDDSSRVST